jgi:hypothetical protein
MTVGEMIEALKRFDSSDLFVVENHEGDYVPMSDRLVRVKIGTGTEHYDCVAVGYDDAWPTEDGGYVYALPEEDA